MELTPTQAINKFEKENGLFETIEEADTAFNEWIKINNITLKE